MNENEMTLGIHERPEPGMWVVLAIQHVFAMFGATILVPILVNDATGAMVLTIPVALFTSGVGTLIYIACTRGRSPVYLGSSFAFIVPIATAYMAGSIAGAMTGVMVVGIIYVLFAAIIAVAGTDWINRLLPPVVVGPMIAIIGLSLASSAVSQIGLDNGSATWREILVALVAFVVTILLMVAGKGFFRLIPVLIGIVAGYVVAAMLGMVDFSGFFEAAFFQMPAFVFPFVSYQPDLSAALTIAPIAFVTMAEHIGDHTALSRIIGKDLLQDPGLSRTLLGDGLATFVAACFGGPANTTYGENTSVVGMTKIASVWVIGLAAIFAICLAFLGKFTALVAAIPNPVLGGVSIVLYGFIAINGFKELIDNHVSFNNMRNVAVAAPMLVLGLGNASIPLNFFGFSVTVSGMCLAAIVGILLNLVLPGKSEVRQSE